MFPFEKTLVAPEGAGRNLGSLALDEPMLAATDDAYANLRLLDSKGAAVPFLARARRINRTTSVEADVAMETVSLETLPGNCIRVLLRKGPRQEGRQPSAVLIHSGLRDFEKQVTVEGSTDGTAWSVLNAGQPIFDYSRFMDVRSTRVEFPAGPYEHFRIVISNVTENADSPLVQLARDTREGKLFSAVEQTSFRRADFRVDRLEFLEKRLLGQRAEAVIRVYSVSAFLVATNAKEKTSVVTFGSPRAPLTEFALQAGDPNYSRAFTLEASDEATGDDGWRVILNGRLAHVSAGAFNLDQTRIELPAPQRFARGRLTIRNQDSPPLDIRGITARGETHELVFLTAPPRAFRVLYGGQDVPAPQYDIGAVLQNAQTAETDEYRPGEQRDNPAYRGERARPPLSAKAMLIIGLVVMVIVLIWVIARAARKIEIPQE
jgi:hypothetical protein